MPWSISRSIRVSRGVSSLSSRVCFPISLLGVFVRRVDGRTIRGRSPGNHAAFRVVRLRNAIPCGMRLALVAGVLPPDTALGNERKSLTGDRAKPEEKRPNESSGYARRLGRARVPARRADRFGESNVHAAEDFGARFAIRSDECAPPVAEHRGGHEGLLGAPCASESTNSTCEHALAVGDLIDPRHIVCGQSPRRRIEWRTPARAGAPSDRHVSTARAIEQRHVFPSQDAPTGHDRDAWFARGDLVANGARYRAFRRRRSATERADEADQGETNLSSYVTHERLS